MYVALSGIFPGLLPQELSGGVVVVDPIARAVERTALDDDDVGGNIGGMAMVSSALGYVIVTDDQYRSSVVAFDPQRAQPLRTVLQGSDFLPEIEVGGAGVLAVPDRSFVNPTLCLYAVPADPLARRAAAGLRQTFPAAVRHRSVGLRSRPCIVRTSA